MDKMWTVLKWNDGTYRIVPDWGDYAWGSPLYEVIGHYETREAARDAVKFSRREI